MAEVEAEVEEATGTTTTTEGLVKRRSAPIAARKGTTKRRIVWNFQQRKEGANQDRNQFSRE